MPDPKKRMCPECGKEFEITDDLTRTPCCNFPLAAYDDRRRLAAVEDKERKAAEEEAAKKAAGEKKKKGGMLGNLTSL